MKKINSLYIHIPYCISKCKYCDFYSIPCNRNKTIPDDYISALCNEIDFRLNECDCSQFYTVYIGGGTPSLLSNNQLSKILDIIRGKDYFKQIKEITIEMNPDDVSEEKLLFYEAEGITRISLGLQSMNDRVLKFCGRRAGRNENIAAMECIKNSWKKDVSVDLISALPEETKNSFVAGLKAVIEFKPDHISLYSLTIEDETPFGKMYSKNLLKYDWDFADEMWLLGRDILVQSGYKQYEVSNFCMSTKECLHNLSYWNHFNYLGCGSGACGTIYPERWTNSYDLGKYISYWNKKIKIEMPVNSEYIDRETEKFEFFMMGFRKLEGITDKEYEAFFNEKIPENIIKVFNEWNKRNLFDISDSNNAKKYTLNEKGILFLNNFLSEL